MPLVLVVVEVTVIEIVVIVLPVLVVREGVCNFRVSGGVVGVNNGGCDGDWSIGSGCNSDCGGFRAFWLVVLVVAAAVLVVVVVVGVVFLVVL